MLKFFLQVFAECVYGSIAYAGNELNANKE